MAKFEMNLPAKFEVTAQRGEAKVEVTTDNLTDSVIEKLVLHGLKQKIADAAAGAKKASEEDGETRSVAEIAQDLMAKVVTNLERGEWGAERGAGTSADPLDKFRLKVVRGALTTNPKLKEQYDAIPSDDQTARREFLMEIAAKKADVVDPAAQKLKAIADQEREAAKVSI